MSLFASLVSHVGNEVAIGVVTGIVLALLFWAIRSLTTGVKEIRGLLVTDEQGLGVMDRLGVIEEKVDELMTPVIETAERTKTLEPNGGSSLHDQVSRIEQATTPDRRPPVKKAPAKRAPARRRTT